MMNIDVYISLGGNLGDSARIFRSAMAELCSETRAIDMTLSDFISTEPWGFQSENTFLNAVACLTLPDKGKDVVGEAIALLKLCKRLEAKAGRDCSVEYASDGTRIYRDRPLDLDILFYGLHRINEEQLTVPHKDIRKRDFVMIPLLQVAKDDIKSAFPEIFESN